MAGAAAALVSFARASWLLDELANLSVSAKSVERVAETLGEDIAVAESGSAAFPSEPPSAPTVYSSSALKRSCKQLGCKKA